MYKLILLLYAGCIAHGQDTFPPSIVVHPPLETVVAETKTVQFTCAAYGLPLPTLRWTKDGTELTSESKYGSSVFEIHTQHLKLGSTTFAVSVLEIDGVNS